MQHPCSKLVALFALLVQLRMGDGGEGSSPLGEEESLKGLVGLRGKGSRNTVSD